MGTEAFIQPGLALSIPLLLLSAFLIVSRPRARLFLVPVLLVPLLAGAFSLGAGPVWHQVQRFAVVFVLTWAFVALFAFVAWLVVSAVNGSEDGSAR